MQVVYADDSRQRGKRTGQETLIALGAAAFPEAQVKPFSDAFYAVYDDFGIPHDVELKWSPDSANDWFRREGKTEFLTPLRESVLKLAASHEATYFAALWDLAAEPSGFQRQTPEHWVLTFLLERIEIFLQNSRNLGVVVFDKPGGGSKDEDAWITDARQLTDLGTAYVTANAIVAPVLTAPSHHHPQLQLADLVAGATTAAFCGSKFGLALMPLLLPRFHRNRSGGDIGGSGIKLWPDGVCNLYHWVLGDKYVTRGSVGHRLPYAGLGRYVTDDGRITVRRSIGK